MTTTVQTAAATKRIPMDSLRKTALVAGVLYLITFAAIATLPLYAQVLNDPNYIVGPGPDTPVIFGGVLEMIVALACIGTAVVLFPVVKRQNEAAALGFVGVRVLEAATIVGCVVSLLSIVTLRQAHPPSLHYSTSGDRCPRYRRSSPSRSLYGSFRWASI